MSPGHQSERFSSSKSPWLSDVKRLGNTQNSHQTRHLMIHDMAMKHPVAGIVSDESAVHGFLGWQQHGVAPLMVWYGGSVPYHQRSEEHTSELQSLTNLVCR